MLQTKAKVISWPMGLRGHAMHYHSSSDSLEFIETRFDPRKSQFFYYLRVQPRFSSYLFNQENTSEKFPSICFPLVFIDASGLEVFFSQEDARKQKRPKSFILCQNNEFFCLFSDFSAFGIHIISFRLMKVVGRKKSHIENGEWIKPETKEEDLGTIESDNREWTANMSLEPLLLKETGPGSSPFLHLLSAKIHQNLPILTLLFWDETFSWIKVFKLDQSLQEPVLTFKTKEKINDFEYPETQGRNIAIGLASLSMTLITEQRRLAQIYPFLLPGDSLFLNEVTNMELMVSSLLEPGEAEIHLKYLGFIKRQMGAARLLCIDSLFLKAQEAFLESQDFILIQTSEAVRNFKMQFATPFGVRSLTRIPTQSSLSFAVTFEDNSISVISCFQPIIPSGHIPHQWIEYGPFEIGVELIKREIDQFSANLAATRELLNVVGLWASPVVEIAGNQIAIAFCHKIFSLSIAWLFQLEKRLMEGVCNQEKREEFEFLDLKSKFGQLMLRELKVICVGENSISKAKLGEDVSPESVVSRFFNGFVLLESDSACFVYTQKARRGISSFGCHSSEKKPIVFHFSEKHQLIPKKKKESAPVHKKKENPENKDPVHAGFEEILKRGFKRSVFGKSRIKDINDHKSLVYAFQGMEQYAGEIERAISNGRMALLQRLQLIEESKKKARQDMIDCSVRMGNTSICSNIDKKREIIYENRKTILNKMLDVVEVISNVSEKMPAKEREILEEAISIQSQRLDYLERAVARLNEMVIKEKEARERMKKAEGKIEGGPSIMSM